MNYAQNLMILTNIDLKWFGAVKDIFVAQTAPLGANYKLVSFDCLFHSYFPPTFKLLTIISLLLAFTDIPQIFLYPLFFSILPFLFSLLFLIYLVLKEREIIWRQMLQNYSFCISISIFFLQSSIFNSLLEVLNCQDIDGKFFVKGYLLESCSSERYLRWIFLLVIPAFTFYAILMPGILLCFMAKNKRNLYKKEVMKYLGLSLNGLGKTKFYWYFRKF